MGLKDLLQNAGLVTADAPKAASTPIASTVAAPVSYRGVGFSSAIGGPDTGNTVGVAPDQSIIDTLNQTADSGTKVGYREFTTILNTLPNTLPQGQRITTALALVETTSGGKIKANDVLVSLDDRIARVEQEQVDYDASYEQQVAGAVTQRQNDVKNIDASIEAKKAEIKELEAHRLVLSQQAEQAELDLHRDKATFNVSFEVVRTALRSEREQIATYIPSSK